MYELSELVYCTRSQCMVFANVDKKIELDYENPVVNDEDFEKLKEEILNK